MKTCYYCNRQILEAKVVFDYGFRYVCKNENDVKMCNRIRNAKKIPQLEKEFSGTRIDCSCGNTFYTHFPLESIPPKATCPHCRKYHYYSKKN